MAPGRRRGGGRLKGTSELRLGDLVLAKVKGFPAWPAKISQPEEWGKTPDPRKYFVYFFGTSEIAFVAPADIQAFTFEVKNKLVGRCKGKPLRFTQAVKEICEEFEKLQPKKLNGSEDDTSRDVLGSEDCSIDADGDNAMEVDMTDDSIVNKSHLQMGTKSLDGSISPLERCSQRPGSIDLDEQKPSTAGNVNGSVSPGIHGKQGTCKTDGPIFFKKEVVSTSGSCSDYLSKKEGSRKVANVQRGQSKRASQIAEVHSDKRSNSLTDATAKASTQTNEKVESNSSKDVKRSEWKGKMDNHPTLGLSNLYPEEDALPPSKRHCRGVEATEERVRKNTASSRIESSSGVSVKPSFSVATKRRAVRLCDDEEEEAPKTPIHAGSASKVSCGVDTADKHGAPRGSSTAVQVMKKRLRVEDRSAKELSSAERLVEDASSSSLKIVETKLKKTGGKNSSLSPKRLVSEKISVKDEKTALSSPKVSPPVEDASLSSLKNMEKKLRKTGGKNSYLSPKKLGSEKISVKDGKTAISSPKVSPASVATSRPTPGIEKPSNGETTKPPECNSQKKSPTSQGIVSGVGERSRTPLHKQMSERSKHNSISDRRKATPKSISHLTDAVLASGGVSGNGSVSGKRLEGNRTDKISYLEDLKISDPDTSMKDLIAAAQAKKRLAHLQNLNSNVLFATTMHAEAARSSPSSVSPVVPLGSSSAVRSDALGLQDHSVSPLSDVQRLSTPFQPETEQCKEKKPESGNWVTETSLSGGTEAAVVRDAFEGMIETLSRTKESISRATRLAIDCAKYGIASEVRTTYVTKLGEANSMHVKGLFLFLCGTQ
ncbi:hypothetical protein Leryth_002941 [Lithospermum erythrorhizon]|nr:hypothetical protein Leryth_002941 [Lithospermum erythrorhizon]